MYRVLFVLSGSLLLAACSSTPDWMSLDALKPAPATDTVQFETEPAGATMKQLHDRQPVILDPAYYDAWLTPQTPVADLPDILAHDIDNDLQFHRVSRDVNASVKDKQRNDAPHFIEPVELFSNPL